MTHLDEEELAVSAAASWDDDGEVSQQRRRVLVVSGLVLTTAVLVLAFVLTVDTHSGGKVSVLIGTAATPQLIGISACAGLVSLAVGLCTVLVTGWWHLLMVPARIAAILAAVIALTGGLLFLSGQTVTPILAGGCKTGYVSVERSVLYFAGGSLERQTGIFVTEQESTTGQDGFHPFAEGAYVVQLRGEDLLIRYSTSRPGSAGSAGKIVVVPVIAHAHPLCTPVPHSAHEPLSAPSEAATPRPAPKPEEPSVEEMISRSLEASVAPVQNADGHPVDAATLLSTSPPCTDNGEPHRQVLTFRTGDNAASVTNILGVWSEAGYRSDRAVQEDIRYSAVLPVDRMSIRDATSIDGLIHMSIEAPCGAGE